MEKSENRIPSLDGLRTISILLVIINHWLFVLGFGDAGNLGNLGVRVFFVISGFLITGLLLKEIEKTNGINLWKFYFRRSLRIFPPFYFYLFVIFLAVVLGFIDIPFKFFLAASFYLSDYLNPLNWLLGHTWSLAVEEQFYLLFPTILLILGIRKTKVFLLLIILINPFIRVLDFQIFGSDPIWVLKGFHANMDSLAAGCLLALFYKNLHQNSVYKRLIRSKIVLIAPLIIILANLQYDHPRIFLGASFTIMNLLIAFCIDWAVTNYDSFAGKILNSAPFVTLGMMSYSIYLWQQPFFNPKEPSILTQTPFNFIGLAVTTLISYFLVEKYSLKIRKKLEEKLFSKKIPSTETLIEETQAS
ncbi:MAG TPA: acyltransferase [Pyrinomonadaceae bacterium]|nr:acyltransferase [Pyrinomonadaceae bacterium]